MFPFCIPAFTIPGVELLLNKHVTTSHHELEEELAIGFARVLYLARNQLDKLHSKSILHRDLDLEHVVVSKESKVVLLDFSHAVSAVDATGPFVGARIQSPD